MINGKTVTVSSNKGYGWHLFTIPCIKGNNKITITFDTKNQAIRDLTPELYLVKDQILISKKITIKHSKIKPSNKLDSPYPLLQNKVRETSFIPLLPF